jgi:uncharacterized protein (TIGR02391 family)
MLAQEYLPPDDELASLPIELLALKLLQFLVEQEGSVGSLLNEHNIGNLPSWATFRDNPSRAFMRYVAEAFAWLRGQGLLAPDPGQGGEWVFITRRGRDLVRGPGGLARFRAERRIDMELHPHIEAQVKAQFLLGQHELAAFAALREVEIRVRELAKAGHSSIGVDLMKQAFRKGGPLRDSAAHEGEEEATMALFWGAIGVFKNPSSHRQVTYDDVTMASEIVLLADLLLRLLDRRTSQSPMPKKGA